MRGATRQRRRRHVRLLTTTLIALTLLGTFFPTPTGAQDPGTAAFLEAWQRTDLPVASGMVTRSWMWGNGALTDPKAEAYADAPGGVRVVQYYDKARMELTDPGADGAGSWHVTTGLLTRELISGRLQLGDTTYQATGHPARIPVAGDPATMFPTYADLVGEIDRPAEDHVGAPVTRQLTPDGAGTYEAARADPQTVIARYVTYTGANGQTVGYNVPRAFWEFMHQPGLVYADGGYAMAEPLFDWLFVLGWPIADPFWSLVDVRGTPTWVLIQPFERRVLTYTPTNMAGWQVEMGNVGRHYFTWRYETLTSTREPLTIVIGDFFYRPRTLTVPAGTTVVWQGAGAGVPTPPDNPGGGGSGDMGRRQGFAHRFDVPGTYGYHSRYYAWMTGTIVVVQDSGT